MSASCLHHTTDPKIGEAAWKEQHDLQGLADAIHSHTGEVPIGGIIAWSGLIANIPYGWHFCNGQEGTPDLRDRFIIGASEDGVSVPMTTVEGFPSQQGGAVAHKHQGPSNTNSGEAALTEGKHTHSIIESESPFIGMGSPGYQLQTTEESPNITDRGHSHGIEPDTTEVNHLPPYYALAYIMRWA